MISVIIPVYNTSEYLDKCIDSVVSQTYKDLEIIVIDDCSTDGSSDKLDRWAERDKRIKVIHNEVNCGVSKSRNNGLLASSGDYIGFVDSDDWIEPDMYEQLLYWIEKTDSDIAFGGYRRHEEKATIDIMSSYESGNVVSSEEALAYCIPQRGRGRYDLFNCDKLFSRHVTEVDGSIRLFDPEYCFCEDVVWFIHCLLQSSRIVFWHGVGYNYRTMRDGNTWSNLNSYNSIKYCDSALRANEYITSLLHSVGSRSENNSFQRVLYYKRFAIHTAYHLNDKELKKKYRKGYVAGVYKWMFKNHSFSGIKWGVKQLIVYFLQICNSPLIKKYIGV